MCAANYILRCKTAKQDLKWDENIFKGVAGFVCLTTVLWKECFQNMRKGILAP